MENQYNKSIEEVLSTLQELQTMEYDPEKGVIETSATQSNTLKYRPPVIKNPGNLVASLERAKRLKRKENLTLIFSVFLGLFLTFGSISLIIYNDQRLHTAAVFLETKIPPPTRTESVTDLQEHTGDLIKKTILRAEMHVSVARELILKGDILAAREILLKIAAIEAKFSKQVYAQVSLALANSFDPNILSKIVNADAGPDKFKAEHWYREWHKANVEPGVTTGTAQLDQILNSIK